MPAPSSRSIAARLLCSALALVLSTSVGCVEEAAPIEVALTLGTNEAGDVFGDTFQTLAPGSSLEVVLGFQLAWMVVIAARLHDLPEDIDRVDYACRLIGDDGTQLAELHSKERPLVRVPSTPTSSTPTSSTDRYLLNIFLQVPEAVATGRRDATLELEVSSETFRGTATMPVWIVGN